MSGTKGEHKCAILTFREEPGYILEVYLGEKKIYERDAHKLTKRNNVQYNIDLDEVKKQSTLNSLFSEGLRYHYSDMLDIQVDTSPIKYERGCSRGAIYNIRDTIWLPQTRLPVGYRFQENKLWLASKDKSEEARDSKYRYVTTVSGPEKQLLLIDYNEIKNSIHTQYSSERKAVSMIVSEPENSILAKYINNFTCTLSGYYIALQPYDVRDEKENVVFTIINKPIYGHVILHTIPDTRFYLKYERNENGALVGEMVRTQLIPLYEEAQEGEIKGCWVDSTDHSSDVQPALGTPVYLSYYDPAGTGKRITREQYQEYITRRKEIISAQTMFPYVLVDLLGF